MKTKLFLIVIWMISLNNYAQNTNSNITVGYLQSQPQTQLNPDNWHYVVVTKSGLNGDVYIDGVLASSSTYSNVPYIWNSLLLGATQGCVSCTPVPNYLGMIDEVRISNTVRTASEIQNNFNSNNPLASDANTLGLFHFDSNTGASIINSAGGNNGDLYGGVAFGTGKFGLGLSFDGVDDYSRISQSIPVDNMTVEFWYKSSDNDAVLAMMEYAYNTGIYLRTSSISCEVPTGSLANGMVAYYPFCGNANDMSGNGNNGTVNGANLTTDRYGISNSAYNFNGTSNYIELGNSSQLDNMNDFSISTWYEVNNISSQFQFLVSKDLNGNAPNGDWDLYVNNNKVKFDITLNTNNNSGVSNSLVQPSIWNHLVITRNSTSGIVKIYINGTLETSFVGYIGPYSNLQKMNFGRQGSSNQHFLNGKLDDIGIWNRELNQQEITYLFNGNLNPSSSTQCWSDISSGLEHSGAIKPNGTLWTWGTNNFGELGYTSTTNINNPAQVGTDANWLKVVCASHDTYAIKTDGTLWAWGNNGNGQLGNGTYNNSNVPIQIGTDNHWKNISSCQDFAIALKTDGTIWAWGYNVFGMLGDGTNIERNLPVQVGIDSNWKTISAGAGFSFAIKTDGTLWNWGYILSSNGSTNYSPIQVGTDNNWKEISAGGTHVMGLKNDNSLWVWGINNYGQVGDNTTINNTIPTNVLSGTAWKSISACVFYSMAIKSDGTLWSWGRNDKYQLGDGTQIEYHIPHQIGVYNDWSKVLGFYSTSYGLRNNEFWYWGSNGIGELIGNGTPIQLLCDNLSINDNFISINGITIYPNPTNSKISIDCGAQSNLIGSQIKITNTLGQEIYNSVLYQQIQDISLSSIASSGMYFVSIVDTQGKVVTTKKLVLQ